MRTKRIATVSIMLCLLVAGCGADGAAGSPSKHAASSPMRLSLHHLWTQSIQPNADSSPAYLPHVHTGGRTRAIVFVLAANNTSNCDLGNPVTRATLYALDAASGSIVWTRSTSGPSRCSTTGPVTDPSGKWVYATGLDGKVHRYAAGSGAETRGHGWPVTYTLMPEVEKAAATPTIGNGRLYVTTSGFIGDQGHYQGHLVTVELSNAHAEVFNSLCSNIRQLLGAYPSRPNYCAAERSGLFGRGEGVVDPVTHDVYVVSGNGPWNGKTDWGDSILKLDPTGAHLLDTYTPTDQAYLEQTDNDLGSTGPAILPAVKATGHTYHLLLQGGKGPACGSCSGTVLRLLDRDNLSGQGGIGHLGGDLQDLATPGACEVLTAPAVWTSPSHQIWVFFANDCGLAGYRLTGPSHGKFRVARAWFIARGGTTPVTYQGVLYVAHAGAVNAYNPTNHALLASAGGLGGIHWEYPLVAGTRLFMTDESGHVMAFAVH